MSDPTPAPADDYNDGKSENFPSDPGTTPTDAPADQVPTDNGGTTPDTIPPTPVDAPPDVSPGSIEGGDVVEGGSGDGPNTDQDPAEVTPPADTDIVTPEDSPAEPETEGPVTPPTSDTVDTGAEAEVVTDGDVVAPATDVVTPEDTADAEADPVAPAEPDVVDSGTEPEAPADDTPAVEPEPSVVDEGLPPTTSPGDDDNIWTVYHKRQKRWFTVRENQGIIGAPDGYHYKDDAKAEGRTLAMEHEVEHIIQNKDGQIGSGGSGRQSYGNDPESREG